MTAKEKAMILIVAEDVFVAATSLHNEYNNFLDAVDQMQIMTGISMEDAKRTVDGALEILNDEFLKLRGELKTSGEKDLPEKSAERIYEVIKQRLLFDDEVTQ